MTLSFWVSLNGEMLNPYDRTKLTDEVVAMYISDGENRTREQHCMLSGINEKMEQV